MSRAMRLRLLALTLLLAPLSYPPSASSQEKSDADPSSCNISEVYRDGGWAVPGLKGAKAKSRRGPLVFHRGTELVMPEVSITVLTPGESQSTFTYYRCSPDHRGRLETGEYPIGILQMFKFDLDGRVFAYLVHFGRERFENGKRVDFGTESQFMFYDLDGSGRFTLRRYSKSPAPEFIPEWAHKK